MPVWKSKKANLVVMGGNGELNYICTYVIARCYVYMSWANYELRNFKWTKNR